MKPADREALAVPNESPAFPSNCRNCNPFGLEILKQVYAPSFEGITRTARAPSGAPALAGPSMAHHQRQVRSHR